MLNDLVPLYRTMIYCLSIRQPLLEEDLCICFHVQKVGSLLSVDFRLLSDWRMNNLQYCRAGVLPGKTPLQEAVVSGWI